MIIKEIVEDFKSREDQDVVKFFRELVESVEFKKCKYNPSDTDDTFTYLMRRKELLDIVKNTSCGWNYLSQHVDLPLDFIREFHTKLSWKLLSYNIPYDEEFIEEFSDRLDWKVLFLKYTFNEDFLFKNQDKIRTAIIRDMFNN